MDPLSILSSLVSAVNYLYTASEKVKENREECKRLCKDVSTIVDLVQQECKDGIPPTLRTRLAKLETTLLGTASTVDELSKRSFLQRALWRNHISTRIQQAYKDIDDAIKELNLAVHIDLYKFQYENEEARRTDSTHVMQHFSTILTNGKNVLSELQIHRKEMQEAMISIYKHVKILPESIERKLFENGMQALQRRSGPLLAVPDEFSVTSLDVIIHHDKKLGEGGFATVYESDWKGIKVAVKELEKGVPSSLIQREIDIWKKLRHPHILEFFGASAIADPPFIVCALKSNGDVVSYLYRNPDANRRGLLHDASAGLLYLHSHNIIHGDLKGANILVDSRGRACLSDFGLSKIRFHSSTRTRKTAGQLQSADGTARWMSPESMMLGIVNKKSDIYSFGMTMYEVFTGLPPFANTPEVMLLSVICDRGMRPPRPDDPEIVEHGLDDSMWELITTCWDKEPERRHDATYIFENLDDSEEDEFTSPLSSNQSSTYGSLEEEFYDLPPSPQSSATAAGTRMSKSKVLQLWAPSTSPKSASATWPLTTSSPVTTLSDSSSSQSGKPDVTLTRPEGQLRAVAKTLAEREVFKLQKSVLHRSARQKEIDGLEKMLEEAPQASPEDKETWKARLAELRKEQKKGWWGNVGPYLDMLCEAV